LPRQVELLFRALQGEIGYDNAAANI